MSPNDIPLSNVPEDTGDLLLVAELGRSVLLCPLFSILYALRISEIMRCTSLIYGKTIKNVLLCYLSM